MLTTITQNVNNEDKRRNRFFIITYFTTGFRNLIVFGAGCLNLTLSLTEHQDKIILPSR